jgi:hypothetical protein
VKLVKLNISNFKNISDSGTFPVNDVTCFVGKSDTGKSNLLHALSLLNHPWKRRMSYDLETYPQNKMNDYHNINAEDSEEGIASKDKVVEATFTLHDSELATLEQKFGEGCLPENEIVVRAGYDNKLHWEFDYNEVAYLKKIVELKSLPSSFMSKLTGNEGVANMLLLIAEYEEYDTEMESFKEHLKILEKRGMRDEMIEGYFETWIPKTHYYTPFSLLDGSFSLKRATAAMINIIDNEDAHLPLTFIKFMGADLDELMWGSAFNYKELRGTIDSLLEEVLKNVSENFDISKDSKLKMILKSIEVDQIQDDTEAIISVENVHNNAVVSLDDTALSYRWILTMLSVLAVIEKGEQNVILLLDNPGLFMQVVDQMKFLGFLYGGISEKLQVMYTSQSPFMIDSAHLEDLRYVYSDNGSGTQVTDDMSSIDPKTRFLIDRSEDVKGKWKD